MLGRQLVPMVRVRQYDSVSIGKGWHKNARTGRWRCNALGNICALQIARIIGFLGRRFWLDPDFFRGNLAHGIVGNKNGVNSRRRSRHGGRGRRQGEEDAGERRLIHGFPYHPKLLPARTSGKIAPVIKRRADNRTIDFRFRPSMVLAMPRKPSYFSSNRIGDLIGKLDVLRVECDKCGLRGSCRVPRSTSLRI